MQDTVINKLSNLGLKAIDWAEITTTQLLAFIEKEAPLLLKEWLQWNLTWSLIWLIIGIGLLIILIIFCNKSSKNNWAILEETDGAILGIWIPQAITSFVIIMINIRDVLQILIAPKIWILENIKEILR